MPTKKKHTNPAAEKIKSFCKHLYPLGWHTITVEYDGSGDSCDYFEQHIANEEGKIRLEDIQLPAGTPFEFKDLSQAIDALLPYGFENNEGGYGTITVNVKTGAITVEHAERYTEVTHSTTKY
jgi:hypothetical protein